MTTVKPRKRRRRTSRFRRQLAIFSTVVTALFVCLGMAFLHLTDDRSVRRVSARERAHAIADRLLLKAERTAYPFSVVHGGVFSRQEALDAMKSDPVVASHYAVFDRTQLRTVASPFTKPVYVSYRKDDAVYWTRRPVRLAAAELLLTDGKEYARARCGNRISESPLAPVAEAEPEPEILDHPESIANIGFLNLVEAPYPPAAEALIGPEDFAAPLKAAAGIPGKMAFDPILFNMFLFPSPYPPPPSPMAAVSLPTGFVDDGNSLTALPVRASTFTAGYSTNSLTVATTTSPSFVVPAAVTFDLPAIAIEGILTSTLNPLSLEFPSVGPIEGQLVYRPPVAPIGSGNSIAEEVPEPSGVWVLGLGLGSLMLWGARAGRRGRT